MSYYNSHHGARHIKERATAIAWLYRSGHLEKATVVSQREIQKLEDVGTKYYAKAMEGEIESAHVYARINERYCAMQGWSSVNIRLDPYAAQVKEEPSGHQKIYEAIMRLKYGPQWQPPTDGNGAALAPPLAPSADDTDGNGSAPPDTEPTPGR